MYFFKYFTPITYLLLILMWSFIFFFYVNRLTSRKMHGRLIFTLLLILAIDAFRTLFESMYFGAWYSSLVGFLPKSVYSYLIRPEIVFIPKSLNVIAAVIVIVILLYRWIPQEEREKEYTNNLVDKQTKELSEINKALRDSQETLRTVIDNSPFPVAFADVNNEEILYWSKSALKKFGHNPKTVSEWYELAYPDPKYRKRVIHHWKHYLEKALKSKETISTGEYEIVCKDGTVKVCEIFAQFIPGYLIVTLNDVTQRKQFEEKLALTERRNQSLLDHSPVCHKIVDLDLNLQYMNASGYKMLKVDEKDNLYGKPYPFDFFPEASRKTLTEKLHEVKKGGHVIAFESMACDSTGNDVWLYHSIIPVLDNDGNIEYITVVSADITEQKNLHDRMRQSEKMESVGRLAGGVAHDFNNLLGPIVGYGEMLLEDTEETDPRYESVVQIVEAGSRASELIRQLLTFSRKHTAELKHINLNDILNNFEKLLRRAIRADIELQMILADNLPVILGDTGQIEQVIMNLTVNARDAMSSGGRLQITTCFEEIVRNDEAIPEEMNSGLYVVLKVIDNGVGMDPEVVEKIFEPFFTTKEHSKGSGLGMATVYGIIKQHRGHIQVQSSPLEGTQFTIYFPVAEEQQKSIIQESTHTQPIRGHETILLAEDSEQMLAMTEKILQRNGYRVIPANNGLKALEAARSHTGPIDFLLSDVVMPEMNGTKLAMEIKELYPGIPVLLMSGYADEVLSSQEIAISSFQFIQKPYSIPKLLDKIRKILDS